MKTFCFVLAACIATAGAASAQDVTPSIPRADVHFVIGWQNLQSEQPAQYSDDWMNDIFYGGAGAGWHWNDHWKTQVDFGSGTHGSQYRFRQFSVNGALATESSRASVRQDSVAISQQFQFFRNQWFHPRVGIGVDLARETTTEEYQPVFVFDNAARTSRLITPARVEEPEHRFIARPFVETGFKGYLTRRAFFTADTRFMFRSGLDEVLFRLGFGVDF
jgi:opacity protein-like surface antigen